MNQQQELKINWFPGHMVTTLRTIGEHLKLCDIIVYVLDGRCPLSCLNPKFNEFTERKPTLFVLNKADLSTVKNFPHKPFITLDSTTSGTAKRVTAAIQKLLADKIKTARAKGINKTIRAIVIGVTNCGKSTLINNLAGKGKTLTGDKPGVTRTKQWVKSKIQPDAGEFWVLDTPGTLYPNLSGDDAVKAKNLAYVGSIRDEVLDFIALSKQLLVDLEKLQPGSVKKRFGTTDFVELCKRRGYILRGRELDEERAAKAILTEFRAGRLGRFNLDGLL